LPIAHWEQPASTMTTTTNRSANSAAFWEHQLDMDPEKRRHASYQLFWIWLSKTWFVQQAVQRNYFNTDFFVWTDIGCFRHKVPFHGTQLVSAAAIQQTWAAIPPADRNNNTNNATQNVIVWMAHHTPHPPRQWLWNDKYSEPQHFYHSGSIGAAYATAWTRGLRALATTLEAFVAADLFIGEDQCVLQAMCQLTMDDDDDDNTTAATLCAYVPFDQVPQDNHYFGLRTVLHGNNNNRRKKKKRRYTIWRPPGAAVV
jgi:hypothetical protein